MKPRRRFVVAALFVVLAALSVHIVAVTLPFWQVSTIPTGDVTQGLWTTCLTDSGSSECWSYSSVEVWLFIVRTLEMMALILLLLAVIAIFVYLLDISWKEILHGMTVVTLLMIVVLILIGLIIYGANTHTGLLHVSFSLAVIAAILALIAAILLVVGCSCCKCCQRWSTHDNDPHRKVMHRESTRTTSLVIEREPTKAWSDDETIVTRRSSQLSWKSSCKVRPESEIRTEYTRSPTKISHQTPVKPFHDEEREPCCKCCGFCCFFTCCKCCRSDKKKRQQREMKRTLENTVCDSCGRDSYQRLIYIDKSTSITSLRQDEIATLSTRTKQERTQASEHTNITHVHGTKTGQVVMIGATHDRYQPDLNNRSTCMTPEHDDGERNRKWNYHKSTPVYCGRVLVANVFSVSQGPHSPCPESVYCCSCKHTTQTKSKEKNPTEQNNGRSEDYLCDCKLGDTKLCDKCVAKRKIKTGVAQSKNQRPKPRTVQQTDRVNPSNAVIRSQQFPDDGKDTITNREDDVQQRKHDVLEARPATNDDSSKVQPSDNYFGLTTNNKGDRMSENDEDAIDNDVDNDLVYNDEQRQDQIDNTPESPWSNNVELLSTSPTNETPLPSRANGGKKPLASRTNGGKKPISSRANGDESPIPSRDK
ncbi:uncharacterized protein LOC117335365 [Pecten maximus]|uniref:uncharacterized protein LOC117335365 n=1 Tax=Pecten maximus TaxID=6579 RepID=UPI001459068C|nr:uncharacterized protein LOC117335365 [Pecten maximus]